MKDIKKILKDDIEQRSIGIVPLLRKEGLVKRLESEIFDNYNKEQEKSMINLCKVSSNEYNIDYVAKIWMIVKVRKSDIDKFVAMGKNVAVELHRGIFSALNNFFHQIEKFVLRGTDKKDISIDCFFGKSSENYAKNLNSAVKGLIDKLKIAGFTTPFILMSDSNIHRRAKTDPPILTTEGKLISKETELENLDDIFKWIELFHNADKENNHKLVCIPKSKQNKPTFKLIEKSPLEVTFRYNGGTDGNLNHVIDICWYGALQIDDPNSIQRIRINLN